MEKKVGVILFAILFVSCVFVHGNQNSALAAMSGMSGMQSHEHQGMQHEHTPAGEEVLAEIKTTPENITAGISTTVVFSIWDREGKPVEDLTIVHDRLVHVVITSQDFSVFAHIHPDDSGPITREMKKTARYPVRFTFPKAGRYIIGVDFAVKGQLFSRHFPVDVAGGPRMGSLTRDLSREKRFGDLDVTFATMPERVMAGKEVMLTYLFKRNGGPVTGLEPYLSAPMHLAIISGDLNDFIHTHGELPGMPGMAHGEHHMMMQMTVPEKFGPKIEVHVVFPRKGLYQIFGQVGYRGKVVLTSFMVEVE